jgi:hypothetical protein
VPRAAWRTACSLSSTYAMASSASYVNRAKACAADSLTRNRARAISTILPQVAWWPAMVPYRSRPYIGKENTRVRETRLPTRGNREERLLERRHDESWRH